MPDDEPAGVREPALQLGGQEAGRRGADERVGRAWRGPPRRAAPASARAAPAPTPARACAVDCVLDRVDDGHRALGGERREGQPLVGAAGVRRAPLRRPARLAATGRRGARRRRSARSARPSRRRSRRRRAGRPDAGDSATADEREPLAHVVRAEDAHVHRLEDGDGALDELGRSSRAGRARGRCCPRGRRGRCRRRAAPARRTGAACGRSRRPRTRRPAAAG